VRLRRCGQSLGDERRQRRRDHRERQQQVKHVQWDGSDFALQSFRPNHHNGDRLLEKVFRLQISGSKGSVVGISEFKNWPTKVSGSSWIDGGTIIGTPYAQIAFWNYPDGGKATKVVNVSEHMAAVTISVGQ